MTLSFAPQVLPLLPDIRRRFVGSMPTWGDVATNEVVTFVARRAREVAVAPFTLVDPSGSCPDDIRKFSAGRTVLVPEARITLLRKARVCGNGLIATADHQLLDESCIRQHHAYPMPSGSIDVRNTKPVAMTTKRIKEPTIILNGVFGLHFSHWTYDNLSRLTFVLEQLRSFKGYRIAVGFGTRRGGWCKPGTTQFASLSMLGFAKDDIVMVPEHDWYEFDQAIAVSEVNNFLPPTGRIWNAPEIFGFYGEIFERAGLARRARSRRVNLSRIDDNKRKCTNESEVIAATTARGFEHRTMAGVPLAEQMQFFSDIDVAVGPVGNNLLTLFAMQKGAKLVTFFPATGSYIMAYYQNFCSALGVELYALCGSREWWEGQPNVLNNLRWEVDVDSLTQLVDLACSAPVHSG